MHLPLHGLSIAAARRVVASALRAKGIDSPELDARVLVGHALGLDHTALVSYSDRLLSPAEAQKVAALAERRLAHEPVARITGHREFWGLDFHVTAATLIPRQDTETVVEATLAAIDAGRGRRRPLRIADLGTGTGALLLALLSELPYASGIGTDISFAALQTARGNAERLGLADQAAFSLCDYASALSGPFDIVVANPPYVVHGEIAGLAADVRNHDPHLALDGGMDGLAAYRAIAADARRILAPDGLLVVEIGAGQAAQVAAIMRDGGIEAEAPANDLSGHARALAGRPVHAGKAFRPPKIALGLSAESD